MKRILSALIVGFVVVALARECTIYDYTAEYSSISEKKRSVHYEWIQPKRCSGGVELPEVFAEVNDSCTIYDFVWKYDCDASTHLATLKFPDKKNDCEGSHPPNPVTGQPCPCTSEDIEFTFTDCDPATNKQSVVFFVSPNSQCEVRSPDLIPAAIEIPCDFSCPTGQKISVSSSAVTCETCPVGTYSIGGGTMMTTFAGSVSDYGFTTSCTGDGSAYCNHWTIEDGMLTSNDNTDVNSIDNSIILSVNLVRAGYVTFWFTVEGEEMYDGLVFYVDDIVRMQMVSSAAVSTQKSIVLSAGSHTLRWTFTNDASVQKGANKAEIQRIEISGTTFAAAQCTPCSLGQYNNETGQDSCSTCAKNYFSNETGLEECFACESTEYSYAGASECIARAACVPADYEAFYTACVDEKRTKKYEWLQPKICSEELEDAVHLPDDEPDQACAACSSGFVKKDGTCQQCDSGYVTTDGTTCTQCAAGTHAEKIFAIDTWDSLPTGFVSYCYSLDNRCGNDGWRPRGSYVDAGIGHLEMARNYMMYPAETVSDGVLHFEYMFSYHGTEGTTSASSLRVYIGSRSFTFLAQGTTPNVWHSFDTTVDAGRPWIYWIFQKGQVKSGEQIDTLKIRSVSLTGDTNGGGYKCTDCADGYYSGAGNETCTACSLGETSSSDHKKCITCEANHFADLEGSEECYSCPEGYTSDAKADHCDPTLPYVPLTANGTTWEYSFNDVIDYPSFFEPVEGLDYTYYISLWKLNHSDIEDNPCVDSDGNSISTLACQVSEIRQSAIDIGHLSMMTPMENPYDGLTVSLYHGERGCDGKFRKLDIEMYCDLTAGVNNPYADGAVESSTPCEYKLKWNSTLACPMCPDEAMKLVEGKCVNGKRTISYAALSGYNCRIKTDQTYTEKCSDVSFSVWTVVFAVLVIVVLVAIIAYVVHRNRSIKAQYRALRMADDGTTLGSFNTALIPDEDDPQPGMSLGIESVA